MFQRFNERAREAIDRAAKKAQELGAAKVAPEHLLAGLTESGESSFHSLLKTFDLNKDTVEAAMGPLPQGEGEEKAAAEPSFSEEVKRIFEYAVEEADKLGHKRIGTSHFLLGIIRDELESESGLQTLTSLGLGLDDVRERVRELAEAEGGGREDVVPAILFFELDRRARDAEKALEARVERLETEARALRGLLEIASERCARLEAALERAEKAEKAPRKKQA